MSVNQLIKKFLEHPLYAAFIIEALVFYAKAVTAKGEPEEDTRSLISQKTWYNIAKDVNSTIESHFKKESNVQTSGDLS